MKEQLLLVDANDEIIGYDSKADCHHGMGKLHRAFSVLMFASDGRLLLQKRSSQKLLWPGFWSNSVCSHPRRGEAVGQAAKRRLMEELGIDVDVEYLYKFQYQERYLDVGSEFEICSVFFCIYDGLVNPDSNEIAEIKYIPVDRVMSEIQKSPESFTPWFKMEWECILNQHMERIAPALASKLYSI